MGLKGSLENENTIRGKVNRLDVIHGKSAYEIAVINGFSGTEKEWLASLKANANLTEEDKKEIARLISNEIQAEPARIAVVELLASKWVGVDSPYSQVVTVEGVTANSQVDLTPSAEQLAIFHEKDLAFVTENEDGIVTVYAIGDKPTNDYTIQATLTEVAYE